MSTEHKRTELIVGTFLLIGLMFIAAMIVIFGRKGAGDGYPITVEFPNASGLVKGCDVKISGAKVGNVIAAPKLIGKSYAVAASLVIRKGVQIPRGATFVIGTNGVLGDSFVDVIPPLEFAPADFILPGDTVAGSRASGLDELTAKGGKMIDTMNEEVLRKVNAELDELHTAMKSINERLLTDKNLKNLEETFASLKTSAAGFAQTSKDLDAVVAKTSEAVDATKTTLKSVDGVATDVRLAVGDFRKVTDSANTLIKKATTGDGTLGTLISDKQAAANLTALIANLRRSGVLFYKDRPLSAPPVSTPPPRSRTR